MSRITLTAYALRSLVTLTPYELRSRITLTPVVLDVDEPENAVSHEDLSLAYYEDNSNVEYETL